MPAAADFVGFDQNRAEQHESAIKRQDIKQRGLRKQKWPDEERAQRVDRHLKRSIGEHLTGPRPVNYDKGKNTDVSDQVEKINRTGAAPAAALQLACATA